MKLSALFRRTLVGQTLLFGLVVGTLSLTSALSLRWYLAGEYSSRGSTIARSIAGVSTNGALADSDEILQSLLDEFSTLQGVAYLFVAAPDGTLVAHTFRQGIPAEFQAPRFEPQNSSTDSPRRPQLRRFLHSPNLEDGNGAIAVDYKQIPDIGYVINLALPIGDGQEGYVYVGLDQVRMINQIRAAALVQLWVMLGLFCLSVVVTYMMVQRISHPLNQLIDYAKHLANRNFSASVSISSADEIGLLADTMKSMALDIQVFIGQLEDALAELQNAQAQLIQTEKMSSLGQLVAGVAHEINNPVSFIACNINYAEEYAKGLLALAAQYEPVVAGQATALIPEDEPDLAFIMEDFPKVLQSMRMGAERIRSIVNSLRNFSRLDEADVKRVNLHEGIDSTLLILNSRLKHPSHSPEIAVERCYGDLPLVECYAGPLNQVFMNILTNAIDALDSPSSPRYPKITIRTVCQGSQVRIAIQDNGAGISPELCDRLFDPFFTTKPVGQGTGLGLAISHQIVVKRHHGQLDCTSEPGQGTTFTVTIPLKQLVPQVTKPAAA